MVLASRSTSARDVIISQTYRPAPYSRQSRRNATLVIPAIGASTTGGSTVSDPRCRVVRSAVEVLTWLIVPDGSDAERVVEIGLARQAYEHRSPDHEHDPGLERPPLTGERGV